MGEQAPTGDTSAFTDNENWSGGYYELAIALGPKAEPGSTDRLRQALTALWSHQGLVGCYLDRTIEPSTQERHQPVLMEAAPLYGLAHVPRGATVVCACYVMRENEGRALDWLGLGLPLGALARIDARVGGYPFGDEATSLAWRLELDRWLATVAERVAAATSFEFGVIGHEVFGDPAAEAFSGVIPSERWNTYVTAANGDIEVHPATR